jgi:hypothetical protein
MNAISKTYPLHHLKAHRNGSRSVWRDIGLGLAVALTVVIMTAVGTRGNSGLQSAGPWSGVGQPKPFAGWEDRGPPNLVPLVTGYAPM